jgi:hypothetical protein
LNVEAVTFSATGMALYMSFMGQKDRLPRKMSDLVQNIGKFEILPSQKYFVFDILAEDEEGNEVPAPLLCINLFPERK